MQSNVKYASRNDDEAKALFNRMGTHLSVLNKLIPGTSGLLRTAMELDAVASLVSASVFLGETSGEVTVCYSGPEGRSWTQSTAFNFAAAEMLVFRALLSSEIANLGIQAQLKDYGARTITVDNNDAVELFQGRIATARLKEVVFKNSLTSIQTTVDVYSQPRTQFLPAPMATASKRHLLLCLDVGHEEHTYRIAGELTPENKLLITGGVMPPMAVDWKPVQYTVEYTTDETP